MSLETLFKSQTDGRRFRSVPAFWAGEVAAGAEVLQAVAEVELALDEQALVVVHHRRLVAVLLLAVALRVGWDRSVRVYKL